MRESLKYLEMSKDKESGHSHWSLFDVDANDEQVVEDR
jgi:hypothetical protein